METNAKTCSRCHELKPIGEFYRQGNRYESFCKVCKRKSRDGRQDRVADQQEVVPANPDPTPMQAPAPSIESFECDTMPVFDESIFTPEAAPMQLGLSLDDLADITAFVRWLMEQKEKQKKKGA